MSEEKERWEFVDKLTRLTYRYPRYEESFLTAKYLTEDIEKAIERCDFRALAYSLTHLGEAIFPTVNEISKLESAMRFGEISNLRFRLEDYLDYIGRKLSEKCGCRWTPR